VGCQDEAHVVQNMDKIRAAVSTAMNPWVT
jgi:hypothetical protein